MSMILSMNVGQCFSDVMQAIDELLKQIERLKEVCASGVKNLDGSAEELYQNSQLVLSRLSSELSAHSSCILDVSIIALVERCKRFYFLYVTLANQ